MLKSAQTDRVDSCAKRARLARGVETVRPGTGSQKIAPSDFLAADKRLFVGRHPCARAVPGSKSFIKIKSNVSTPIAGPRNHSRRSTVCTFPVDAMQALVAKVLAASCVMTCVPSVATAATIQIGLLSLDSDASLNTFNVTNLTGPGAPSPDFPIETLLAFTVTGVNVSVDGGGSFSIGPGAFTTDGSGNVNCTAAGGASTGDCNFAAYQVLGATLTGTLAPTAGLVGLPAGFLGIESAFTASLTPGCSQFLEAGCDAVIIEATLVADSAVPVPEPSTAVLVGLGTAALGVYRRRRNTRARGQRA